MARGVLRSAAMNEGWLKTCGIDDERVMHWWVEARLECESDPATELELRVQATEWMITFRHDGRVSVVRVAGAAAADPRDDHELLPHVSSLEDLGGLLRLLETRYRILFRRYPAPIHSNLRRAATGVRGWLASL